MIRLENFIGSGNCGGFVDIDNVDFSNTSNDLMGMSIFHRKQMYDKLRSYTSYLSVVKPVYHSCLETCYWHFIEKRFCFDESIAMYEEPVAKEERNNNLFDNMAFYDSVSVIAGRAVVTIDPLPAKKSPPPVVVQQPKRLTWREKMSHSHSAEPLKKTPSVILEKSSDDVTSLSSETQEMPNEDENLIMMGLSKKTVSFENMLNKSLDETDRSIITSKSENTLSELNVELKKKSLKDRRMSKSLYLKIGEPREVPIIRQNSVPKFYLDTPERNQKESALIKTPLTSLQSPICNKDGFCYDLKSVVQIQKTIRQNSCKDLAVIHKESSRLSLIKERMKLKKSKSTVSASNIPHSNYI